GFFPKPALDVINPAVTSTQHDTGQTDPAAQHPAAENAAASEGTGK
ncbi:MAG: hypothetical protein QOK14_367, partial [Frankiaceae bacterium]|nr:hypothetical protein [Frankiaceae bacterium]